MPNFKSWGHFDTFKSIQKWDLNGLKKIFNNNTSIDVSKPLKFEYVAPDDYNGDVFEALDAGKPISIVTPYSDRYAGSDGTQHLPYNLRNVHDPNTAEKYNVHAVKSTCIASWEYDPNTGDLTVYFTSDSSKGYLFPKVPKDVVKRWINAPSKGQYYWRVIRRYADYSIN